MKIVRKLGRKFLEKSCKNSTVILLEKYMKKLKRNFENYFKRKLEKILTALHEN